MDSERRHEALIIEGVLVIDWYEFDGWWPEVDGEHLLTKIEEHFQIPREIIDEQHETLDIGRVRITVEKLQ